MPPTPYIIEEYVRWSDVDFAGIIFYGSYVRFFEIAETELFRACGLAYAKMFDRYDVFLPRKAVHSEFYSPARLDDRLRVATYVGRVGTTYDPQLRCVPGRRSVVRGGGLDGARVRG